MTPQQLIRQKAYLLPFNIRPEIIQRPSKVSWLQQSFPEELKIKPKLDIIKPGAITKRLTPQTRKHLNEAPQRRLQRLEGKEKDFIEGEEYFVQEIFAIDKTIIIYLSDGDQVDIKTFLGNKEVKMVINK